MGSLGVYPTTSVIQGNLCFYDQISLWEALAIVSQEVDSIPHSPVLETFDREDFL